MTTKNKQAARAKARAACLFGGLLETSTFPGSRFRLFKRKQAFLSELIGKQPDRIRQRPSDRNGPPDPAHAECGYGGQQICRRDARAQRNDRENHAHPRFSKRTVVSHVSHHNQNKSTVHRTVLLFWQGQEDSNPRPTVLETGTLPAELYPCLRRLLAT